jgi:hypothetical protein
VIRNTFIPNKIGEYYIFTQRIIGLITKSNRISAVKITRKATDATVELASGFPLSEGPIAALDKLGKFNKLHLSLSNQDVIFKELNLPFLEHEKIKMVLPFEIESSLPFPILDAYIDFIITGQDKKNKTTSVMAAITKKSEIETLTAPLKKLENIDSTVTVNAVSSYCLYKQINSKEASLLLEVSTNSISISYINKEQRLRLVRTAPKGISIQDNPKSESDIKWLTDEILFSINSFKTQLLEFDDPEKIIIIWNRPPIEELDSLIYKNTNILSEHFPISKIQNIKEIKGKIKITQEEVLAFATAFTTKENASFDLQQTKAALSTKQFILTVAPSLTIIFVLLFSLIFIRKFKLNSLEKQITQSKQQVLGRLQQTFNITDKKSSRSLSLIAKAAEKIVTEEENLWFSFSKKVRFSYLRYLEELSKVLNKKELGLTINKLSILNETITLQGEVSSYPQLEELYKSLEKSNLFSHIARPEQLKFSIKITLKKNNEDEE